MTNDYVTREELKNIAIQFNSEEEIIRAMNHAVGIDQQIMPAGNQWLIVSRYFSNILTREGFDFSEAPKRRKAMSETEWRRYAEQRLVEMEAQEIFLSGGEIFSKVKKVEEL